MLKIKIDNIPYKNVILSNAQIEAFKKYLSVYLYTNKFEKPSHIILGFKAYLRLNQDLDKIEFEA